MILWNFFVSWNSGVLRISDEENLEERTAKKYCDTEISVYGETFKY